MTEKEKRELSKMLSMIQGAPCALCSLPASQVNTFLPLNSKDYGAPAGKQRIITYGLCAACSLKPGASDQAEQQIKQDASKQARCL